MRVKLDPQSFIKQQYLEEKVQPESIMAWVLGLAITGLGGLVGSSYISSLKSQIQYYKTKSEEPHMSQEEEKLELHRYLDKLLKEIITLSPNQEKLNKLCFTPTGEWAPELKKRAKQQGYMDEKDRWTEKLKLELPILLRSLEDASKEKQNQERVFNIPKV